MASKRTPLPKGILAIGMVSLLMDTSSEMIHSLLPIFVTTSLGLSPLFLGLLEGIGEGTAQIIRVFSGTISDNLGRRKPFMILGYGLSALTKPLFALATGGWMILAARTTDRLGKGLRSPPRDAMVADITPEESRGAAYGFRQSLDNVGAFLGPSLAVAFMFLLHEDIRLVFSIAVIPAVICVLVLIFVIKEPPRHKPPTFHHKPIEWYQIRSLGQACWAAIIIASITNLAEFSEAFIILKASHDGLAPTLIPFVLIVMNVVYALTAYPFGRFSDTARHDRLLIAGMMILIAADLVFATSNTPQNNMAGVVLWGLHLGMTQGLLSTMIANTAPADLRATAFGVFGLIGGLMSLFASLIAGFLWTMLGASFPFYASIGFSLIVILLLLYYPRIKLG